MGLTTLELLVVAVPALPLAGFLILALGRGWLEGRRAAVVGSAVVAIAFGAALALAARLSAEPEPMVEVTLWEWIHAGREEIALTVAGETLENLVPVKREQLDQVWWPADPALDELAKLMWQPDGAAGVRPMMGDIPAGSIVTAHNLPPSPTLVPATARRAPMQVDAALMVDRLALLMILVVTGVGLLIHVYSGGYMRGDEDMRRYFAYLNLFTFSMLVLVLAANYLVLFVGWELVGLCSYLLIGFWYADSANASAGRKAFVVNRVGDFAFIIGLLAIWSAFGTLTIEAVNSAAAEVLPLGGTLATLIALCLLVGATGKSAQLPLFVWLPDAMAGPTPVSALIHAATMVTAGIYLIARSGGLFAAAPSILVLVAIVGAATALLGALVATVQPDIKRTLAYSTISQLGFMFLALGVGGGVAAVFHLVTHAFFKALLFLGAGSVMHGMEHGLHAEHAGLEPAGGATPAAALRSGGTNEPAGGATPAAASDPGGTHEPASAPPDVFAGIPAHQDMRLMGGLRRAMPWTAATFAVGALALAGVFPLAGFWSKDEILYDVFVWEHGPGQVLYWVALATAAITAYYAGRALFMTFLGQPRSGGAAHAHESPPAMVTPLVVLALATVFGGLLVLPSGESSWLAAQIEGLMHGGHGAGEASKLQLALLASAASLVGLGVAWMRHRRGWVQAAPALGPVRDWTARAFYVDQAYGWLFVRPFGRIAAWLWHVADDRVIDGAVNAVARLMPTAAQLLRRTQTGYVRSYALSMLLGAAAIAVYLVLVGRP